MDFSICAHKVGFRKFSYILFKPASGELLSMVITIVILI